jgi:hypothetical protein
LILCGTRFDRGRAPVQDFSLLADIWNSLIHLKTEVIPENKRTEDLLRALESKGLIPGFPKDLLRRPWADHIQTPDVARWAVNTAVSVINSVWADATDTTVIRFFNSFCGPDHAYQPIP